jgi:hypothetical protein
VASAAAEGVLPALGRTLSWVEIPRFGLILAIDILLLWVLEDTPRAVKEYSIGNKMARIFTNR